MIQRIQTIYLLFIAGLMLAMLFLPIAFISQGDSYILFRLIGNGEFLSQAKLHFDFQWLLTLICGATSLLSLVTIFLYKNRKKQQRICSVILIMLLLFYVAVGLLYWLPNRDVIQHVVPQIAFFFPFVCLILDVLAMSSIRKDEKLVRSADRLR